MADPFNKHISGLDSPAKYAEAVVPDDSNDINTVSRALYVGTAGDLAVTMAGGGEVTLRNASGWLPIRVSAVKATGTTATDIVAVW